MNKDKPFLTRTLSACDAANWTVEVASNSRVKHDLKKHWQNSSLKQFKFGLNWDNSTTKQMPK